MKKIDVALWRYQVIASLLTLPDEPGALKCHITTLASREWKHPERGSIRPGYGTIEHWYYTYKAEGLEGLKPHGRKDKGVSRSIDAAMAEAIEELITDYPQLTGPDILKELKAREFSAERIPSRSSLYRFLHERGLDRRTRPLTRDHRAFGFEFPNDCWYCDVMYGNSIPCKDGRRRKTYLIAFIDDASRLVPHAQFYFDQTLSSFKDALKQALLKRGSPKRIYLDNGKIFRSRMLLLVAARLGMQIIHSKPYTPQGRGKMERFFRSIRDSFLVRCDTNRLTDIDSLNRYLHAFVEGEYHVRKHRGIDESPLDRWIRLSEHIRPIPDSIDLDALFHDTATRRVAKDGTFSIKGARFEAGPMFIGAKIHVRFDPYDLRVVFIRPRHVEQEGEEEIAAYPVDIYANRKTGRIPPVSPPPKSKPKTQLVSLSKLVERIEQEKGGDNA